MHDGIIPGADVCLICSRPRWHTAAAKAHSGRRAPRNTDPRKLKRTRGRAGRIPAE